MTCAEIEEKIADYATGRLDASVAAGIAGHLATCDSCRAFAEDVRSLYNLVETPLPQPSSAPAHLPPLGPSGPGSRIERVAIAAMILIGVILVLYATSGGDRSPPGEPPASGGPDPRPALAALPLLTVEVTLPRVPSAYRVGTWLDSREEATLLASFTGKPLLEQYRFPQCPICLGAEKSFDRPEARDALAGFVLYRGNVEVEVPSWLDEAIPANPDLFPLPAMRVSERELESEPHLGVSNLESLLDLVREWNALDARRDAQERESIDEPVFVECTRQLDRVAQLVRERSFTEAVRSLEELSRLGVESDTAFASCAEELLAQLRNCFERQLAEIERLYAGTEEERSQAVDLARRFRVEVQGLPIETRLAAYLE